MAARVDLFAGEQGSQAARHLHRQVRGFGDPLCRTCAGICCVSRGRSGFSRALLPEAAARDLTPLSDPERDYIERAFGDLDRDWPNSDLSELFEILPIERAAAMSKHYAARVEP